MEQENTTAAVGRYLDELPSWAGDSSAEVGRVRLR